MVTGYAEGIARRPLQKPFWQSKSLQEMSREEWESLCDGCGFCCLVKLEDEETDEVYVTNVACAYLDLDTCRCRDYANRLRNVPACLQLSPERPELYRLLPQSCTYRRLHEGQTLEDWHPLITHDPDSTRKAGITVCEHALSEKYIHPEQLQDHVLKKLDDV